MERPGHPRRGLFFFTTVAVYDLFSEVLGSYTTKLRKLQT
jgi:hypothetical protein